MTPLDQLQRARADVLRGQIAFARGRGSDAPPLLFKAARRLEPLHVSLAREAYLEALGAAMFAAVSAARLGCGRLLMQLVRRRGRTPPRSRHGGSICSRTAW